MPVPSNRKWIADDLAVVTQSKDLAGDFITEAVLDQVFGEKAFDKFGKFFISMHFSDQHPSSHRKILIFKFALPAADQMADMTRLVALIPYYIDLIGRYKLSSQVNRDPVSSEMLKMRQQLECLQAELCARGGGGSSIELQVRERISWLEASNRDLCRELHVYQSRCVALHQSDKGES